MFPEVFPAVLLLRVLPEPVLDPDVLFMLLVPLVLEVDAERVEGEFFEEAVVLLELPALFVRPLVVEFVISSEDDLDEVDLLLDPADREEVREDPADPCVDLLVDFLVAMII